MPRARLLLWWATVAALGLVLRAVLIAPVDGWLAGLALAGYVSLVLAGIASPQWEMYGDVFWQGDPNSPRVAITFDDGPDPQITPRVLDVLQSFGMIATFFVVGERAARHPDLVRAIFDRGHQLALHGYRHFWGYAFWSPGRVERDVRATQRAVFEACGQTPTLFRPPFGQISPRTVVGAKRARVALIGWSLRTLDGLAGSRPEAITQRVNSRLRPGSILLLHDAARAGNLPPASLEVLPRLLTALQARGLEPVTISQLAVEAGWQFAERATEPAR